MTEVCATVHYVSNIISKFIILLAIMHGRSALWAVVTVTEHR